MDVDLRPFVELMAGMAGRGALSLCKYTTINGDGDAAYVDLRWFVEFMERLSPKPTEGTFVFVVFAVCMRFCT